MSRTLPPPSFGDLGTPRHGPKVIRDAQAAAWDSPRGRAWAKWRELDTFAQAAMKFYLAGEPGVDLAEVASACRRAIAARDKHTLLSAKEAQA